jgi:hypothetical protein
MRSLLQAAAKLIRSSSRKGRKVGRLVEMVFTFSPATSLLTKAQQQLSLQA